jgi:hypothetical protein
VKKKIKIKSNNNKKRLEVPNEKLGVCGGKYGRSEFAVESTEARSLRWKVSKNGGKYRKTVESKEARSLRWKVSKNGGKYGSSEFAMVSIENWWKVRKLGVCGGKY